MEHRTPRYDQFSNSDQPRWHDGNLSLLRRVHHLVTDLRVQALTFRADIPVAWVEQLSVAAMHSLAQLRPGGVKALTLCWPALPLSAAAVKAMPHCAAGPTWLELSACQVPAETAGAVRQLTSLSALRLVGWGDDMVHGPGPALPPGVVRILPRLSRLRELHISFPAEAGILAEVLPRLPRLRSLACRVYAAEPLMASVSALSALIQLELVFTASASLPDLRPLTQLQCLEALTLTEHYADHLDSGYVCPPPSAFPRLSMFNIDGFLPDAIHLPVSQGTCCIQLPADRVCGSGDNTDG